MHIGKVICLITLMVLTFSADAQKSNGDQKMQTGVVTDFNGQPIKRVVLYVDSVKTKRRTNSKGKFKIIIPEQTKSITFFHPAYGKIDVAYSDDSFLNVQFPKGSLPMSEMALAQLGYNINFKARTNTFVYSDYKNVYDILRAKFPNVRVNGTSVVIGRGINVFNADSSPLFLVNNIPTTSLGDIPTTEIKDIKVIQRGSETANYGMRGANGVILITLRNNE